MKVVILAGGKGQRLRPYTYILPKPLLPIGETAILDIVLERLKKQGISDITLAVNYKSHLFESIYGDGSSKGMNISYIKESQPLGTAGALKYFKPVMDEVFFVMNGDLLTDINVSEVKKFQEDSGSDITIVVKKMKMPINFGVINSEGDRVVGWEEKPEREFEASIGMYMLRPSVIKYIPEGKFFDMPDLVKAVIANGGKVTRFLHHGQWIDIGRESDYSKAQKDFCENGEVFD